MESATILTPLAFVDGRRHPMVIIAQIEHVAQVSQQSTPFSCCEIQMHGTIGTVSAKSAKFRGIRPRVYRGSALV